MSTPPIHLHPVLPSDLPHFFDHQSDPEACRMAAFPARDHEAFLAHWSKILADEFVTARTVLLGDQVAGSVVSWEHDGKRLVGYWIGREHWNKGVATQALAEFLRVVTTRPLFAYVVKTHAASIRVLEKCGFTPADEQPPLSPDGVEELLFQLVPESQRLG